MKKRSSTQLLILAALMFIMLPVVVSAAPVPDTGQTQSYTNTFGEDSDYSCNPHSYTNLGNGIVRDNVTGLEWQQATAPGTHTWQQAIDYCDTLDLGGKDDWRLPTVKELSLLVDSSIPETGPAINTSYFPDTVASDYWSSTTFAGGSSLVWHVGFAIDAVAQSVCSSFLYVRAVRGGQSSNNFVDNSDGTISDTSTGLMWQKATAPGTFSWEEALTYCENLTLGGHSDWRLPNRNELQSIVNYSRYTPAIDTTYFPITGVHYHWSSTTYANDTGNAWFVDFNFGYVGNAGKYFFTYVRAVRGGQCGGFDTSTTTSVPVATTTTTVCDADCWKAAYEQSQAQLQQCQTELQACQNITTTSAPPTISTSVPPSTTTSSVITTTTSLPPLLQGLVTYYPFNGSANDESGNGIHATVHGAVLTTDISGKANMAYYFDGVDDYMSTNSSTLLAISNEATVGAWIKGTGSFNDIARIKTSGDDGFEIAISSNGTARASAYLGGAWVNATCSVSVNDDYWHYVVAVIKPNTLSLFVDGVFQSSTIGNGNLNMRNESVLTIGRHPTNPMFFAGVIDDVRIYNRALSETEVQALYADTDYDGIPDTFDNCPNNCNVQQLDADGDGIGDVCDPTPGCGGCGQPQCEQECFKYTI
jgi:hypothetical protein